MPFVGFVIAMMMLFNFKRHWRAGHWGGGCSDGGWGRHARERDARHLERARRADRRARRRRDGCGWDTDGDGDADASLQGDRAARQDDTAAPGQRPGAESPDAAYADKARANSRDARHGSTPDEDAHRRARRRARAEAAFFGHLVTYLSVIALLAFINLVTGGGPWFLWPAFGWGIGICSHFMSLFGSRMVRERFFEPALERELRRERVVMQTEKQASIDELSSTIAHEIRNPIAAAKSLVQQMGEDPHSVENVEYARVALE